MSEIDTDPNAIADEVMEVSELPHGFVNAFQGEREQRDATRQAFLERRTVPPVLNERTNLDDRAEHVRRRQAYGSLSAIEGYLADKDEPLNEAERVIAAQVGKQKAELAFMQGAEAMARPGREHGAFMERGKLLEQMREWSERKWGQAHPATAKALAYGVLPETYFGQPDWPLEGAAALAHFHLIASTHCETEKAPFMPSDEIVTHVHELVMDRFGGMLDAMWDGVEGEKFSEEEAVPIVAKALDHLGLSERGWKVVYDKNRNNMSTDNRERIVYIGKREKPFSRTILSRLTIHEVGVHAVRFDTAETAGMDKMVQKGLPGNSEFEEAFANALEHAYVSKIENRTARTRYIAGSFAQGAIDGEHHDFPATFDFVFGYVLASDMKAGKVMDAETVESAKSFSYDQTLRFFRAMPGDAGVNDLSALSYYAGFEKVWQHFAGDGQPITREAFDALFAGKFDPTRPDHVEYVARYGRAA
jgi:hypothetical protein